jgi:hypothetical protein
MAPEEGRPVNPAGESAFEDHKSLQLASARSVGRLEPLQPRVEELEGVGSGDERLEWSGEGGDEVLHFIRPGGWQCVTNFGTAPVDLPDGDVIVSEQPDRGEGAAFRLHRLGQDAR